MSYRVKQRTPMTTGETHIRLGLEVHHVRTHMNVVTAKDLPSPGGRSEDRNYKNTYDERSPGYDQESPMVKVTQAPSNANPLGLVLSELSVPASVAVQTAGILGTGGFPTAAPSGNSFGPPPPVWMSILFFGGKVPVSAPANNLTISPPVLAQAGAPVVHTTVSPFGVGPPKAATTNNLTKFLSGGAPATAPRSATVFPLNGGQCLLCFLSNLLYFLLLAFNLLLIHSLHLLVDLQGIRYASWHGFVHHVISLPQLFIQFSIRILYPWNSSIAPNTQGPPSIPAAQTSQAVSKQPSPQEVKPSGRKELPEDLFAPSYPSSAPYPGWQTGPPQGIWVQYAI
ncbi:hypothetical protein Acr_02g0004560 [Actinidia rufa]|uniref:Uncharacterized protein n=1 Tax=Actinidia rufa TaxID=165716 RepID=A0A7J0E7P2_9ERIC|nr:hypothetical protein Acr_02g0004560 [Actinidia rufa]